LDAYYKKIGGRPRKTAAKPAAKVGPGRKRKSMAETKETSASAEPTEQKRRRKSSAPATEEPPTETAAESEEDDLSWTPKGKDWGSHLEKVDTIIRDQDSKQLFAFLLWKNGKRSRVALETCYDRCPKQVSTCIQQIPKSQRLTSNFRCFSSMRTICKIFSVVSTINYRC
jgi:chromobox protein 1